MDVLAVILLLVILIIIINNKWGINQKFNDLELRLMELQNLLTQRELQTKTAESVKPEVKPVQPSPAEVPKTYLSPNPEDNIKPIPSKLTEVKPPAPPKPEGVPLPTVVERHEEVIEDKTSPIKRPVKTWQPPIAPKEPELSFFERYPDMEKFIGENLINKIGIAILVLAIGFFVKFAIDNNWIGPIGRVGIGILCGGILVGVAHWLRNSYKAFSSVLVGGGIAVFYFTITLAFQQFHIFSQTVAFIILVVITIFAVALSLLYDRQELAVIALIGGFASPFMVSTGAANYNTLFIYLLILNTGLLILAYFKAWRILNISSFGLSVIVFASVLYTITPANYYIGFRYATIFYLLFFTINIINNIREKKSFLGIDFSILLINTALYFGAGLYLLTEMGQTEYRGLFSAALALINLVLSYILFRKKTVDPNILYLLIGITLTFISLTAPIQLHGNSITLFWAAETVLLYWLYLKSTIKLMKLTSLLIWLAMFISLFIDLSAIYGNTAVALTVIANKGFITTIVAATGSYLLYILVKKDPQPDIYGFGIPATIYQVVAFILLFVSGILEINHQFSYHFPGTGLNMLYLMLYVPIFVYLFVIISEKVTGDAFNWRISMGLLIAAMVVYLGLTQTYFNILGEMLEHRKIPTIHFVAHWFSAIVVGSIFYKLARLCSKLDDVTQNTAAWLLSAAIVLFLSLEFCLASEQQFYYGPGTIDHIRTVYIKTGLPVLWGVLSFVLMWLGMRNKQRNLRIISLTLFLITLIKLFLFDINNIPVAGKIIAFFCLGVLLLIISFMYQKVKKIIVDDEKKAEE